MDYDPKKFVERRQERRNKPDALLKWVRFVGIFSWILFFIVLMLLSKAQPPFESYFDRLRNIPPMRKHWDYQLLQYAIYIVSFEFFLSLTTILLNSFRQHRKTDRFSFSVILNTIFSFLTILILIFYFNFL